MILEEVAAHQLVAVRNEDSFLEFPTALSSDDWCMCRAIGRSRDTLCASLWWRRPRLTRAHPPPVLRKKFTVTWGTCDSSRSRTTSPVWRERCGVMAVTGRWAETGHPATP
jgi:hypothetical protein